MKTQEHTVEHMIYSSMIMGTGMLYNNFIVLFACGVGRNSRDVDLKFSMAGLY